jgi:hypothetical protein
MSRRRKYTRPAKPSSRPAGRETEASRVFAR